jgi:hypothetical protein
MSFTSAHLKRATCENCGRSFDPATDIFACSHDVNGLTPPDGMAAAVVTGEVDRSRAYQAAGHLLSLAKRRLAEIEFNPALGMKGGQDVEDARNANVRIWVSRELQQLPDGQSSQLIPTLNLAYPPETAKAAQIALDALPAHVSGLAVFKRTWDDAKIAEPL